MPTLWPTACGPFDAPLVAAARHLVRSLVAALVIVGPAILPALASASPPDPSWLAGVCDAADHDDVIVLAESLTGHIALATRAGIQERPPLVGGTLPPAEGPPALFLQTPAHPRAPPLSAPPLLAP